MSTFRHVNVSSMSPRAHSVRNTGISRFKSLRKHSRILRRKQCGSEITFSQPAVTVHLHQSHQGDRYHEHKNDSRRNRAVAVARRLREEGRGCCSGSCSSGRRIDSGSGCCRHGRRCRPGWRRRCPGSGRDAAGRPAAGRAAEAVRDGLLGHSVIVPISTSNRRTQDTGRDSPPGILPSGASLGGEP
jgi:hypothetical protein